MLVGRRALPLAAMVFVAGCANLGPRPVPAPPLDGFALDRFQRVDEGVYRSAQPTGEQLAQLVARYHIRTVLKLNRGADVAPTGVAMLHYPLDAIIEPSAARLREVLDA